jgi:glycosyltransferase involved in cell wall biosynthesis
MTLLSILICTIPGRAKTFLPSILDQLKPQYEHDATVEVLYLGDNKSMTVGEKRNWLVKMAKGEYVVFVDDDDRIAPDYVTTLLSGITLRQDKGISPDAVCFHAEIRLNGGLPVPVYYSAKYGHDQNLPGKYLRIPNHLMCVKRRLALDTPYADISRGEDADYARRLLPKIQIEHLLAKTLYYYDFNSSTTEAQKQCE